MTVDIISLSVSTIVICPSLDSNLRFLELQSDTLPTAQQSPAHTHARTHKTSEKKINMKNDMKHGTLNIFVISLIFKLIIRLGYSIKMVMSPNGPLLVIRYNRLSLSRIPRDSLKHFEISVPRDVRVAEVRKTINWIATFNKWICYLTLEVRNMYKIMWKRGEIAPEEQFLLFSTIFSYLFLDFHVKTGTRISLRYKRLFEISEFEITRVDCTYRKKRLIMECWISETNMILEEFLVDAMPLTACTQYNKHFIHPKYS